MDLTLYIADIGINVKTWIGYNYKRRTTTETKVFACEKFSQILNNLITTGHRKIMPIHDFSCTW